MNVKKLWKSHTNVSFKNLNTQTFVCFCIIWISFNFNVSSFCKCSSKCNFNMILVFKTWYNSKIQMYAFKLFRAVKRNHRMKVERKVSTESSVFLWFLKKDVFELFFLYLFTIESFFQLDNIKEDEKKKLLIVQVSFISV